VWRGFGWIGGLLCGGVAVVLFTASFWVLPLPPVAVTLWAASAGLGLLAVQLLRGRTIVTPAVAPFLLAMAILGLVATMGFSMFYFEPFLGRGADPVAGTLVLVLLGAPFAAMAWMSLRRMQA